VSEPGTGDIPERVAPATKDRKDWGAYAAVIASLIGILALAVSGYTAYLQRQQLRAQMWPHLRLEFSSVNLTFSATNQGTGPARVSAIRVTVDGAAVGSWSDVMKAAGFTGDEDLILSDLSDAVLSPGKVFTFVEPAENEQSRAKFKELLPGHKHALSVTVCYCSVLDECWVANLDAARKDSTCPITAAERFSN
jgi:hypothetical protein